MNKIQVKQVLDYLEINYKDFRVSKEMFEMWLDELQQYDYEDVITKLKELMSSGHYISTPPHLVTITNGLAKIDKKIDWSKTVVLCKNCNKGFNVDDNGFSQELKDHEERCNSINYVIRQSKKWFNKDLTRGELWSMSREEFDERYDKLLHYIYEHTDNETEKTIIGYIFNPPSPDTVREMFVQQEEV